MEIHKKQVADIVLGLKNFPFATMKESKIPNIWYHEETNYLFILTNNGFKKTDLMDKKSLFANQLQ